MKTAHYHPKISVVMSTFNDEDFLGEAITSILNQSFRDFEFIIIDDGSVDNTNKIIQKYARQDRRIKLLTHKKNKGLIAALNNGFTQAQGKYIARMDADDISMPDRLITQYAYMERHSDVVVLGTQSAFMDELGQAYAVEPYLLDDHDIRTEILLRNRQFRHGAVMIRRTVVSEAGELYDPEALHYEDFELWPRLLKHGKGANLRDVLYLYRQSPMSLTATKKSEMKEGTESVMHREQNKAMPLPLHFKDIAAVYRQARTYAPNKVIVNNRKLRTGLKWQYQSYIFALSKLYANNKTYTSAITAIIACFCINPIRFCYAIFDVAVRSFGGRFTVSGNGTN